MGRFPTDHFIKEKVEVEDKDRREVMRRRQSNPLRFRPEEENVVLAGFAGSGRMELGRKVSQALGLALVDLTGEPAADDIARVRDGRGLLAVCGAGLAAVPGNLDTVAGTGRVFYILTDVPAFLDRAAARDKDLDLESLRLALVEAMQEYEPAWMARAFKLLRYEREQDFIEKGDDMEAVTTMGEVESMAAVMLAALSGRP